MTDPKTCQPAVIHGATGFDPSTAAWLARAADLVYQSPDMVRRAVTGEWELARFRFYDVEGTQCFLAADDALIVLAFRGTERGEVQDWITDLDFDLIAGPLGGRVHEGFYDALSCVWDLVDHEVTQLLAERPRRLWVTGHSLGGALAALAVARWYDAGLPVSALYTFGQPRIGDRPFARNFDFALRSRTFRVVNHRDIVTRTPPRSLGYRHLGAFIYLSEDGTVADDITWWRRFLTGWQGTIETILDWGGEGIDDHRMVHYRRAFDAHLAPLPSAAPAAVRPLIQPRRAA